MTSFAPLTLVNQPFHISVYSKVSKALKNNSKGNRGYGSLSGSLKSRETIQKIYCLPSPDHVIITHSVSYAVMAAVQTLMSPGNSYFVPKCHTLEMKLASFDPSGVGEPLFYSGLSELTKERLLKEKCQCVVLANPCIFSGKFIQEEEANELIRQLKATKIPLVLYENSEYFSTGRRPVDFIRLLREEEVPCLIVEGAGTRYGLRSLGLGWVALSDPKGVLSEVFKVMGWILSHFLHPSRLAEESIPQIEEAFQEDKESIQAHLNSRLALLKSLITLESIQKEKETTGRVPVEFIDDSTMEKWVQGAQEVLEKNGFRLERGVSLPTESQARAIILLC